MISSAVVSVHLWSYCNTSLWEQLKGRSRDIFVQPLIIVGKVKDQWFDRVTLVLICRCEQTLNLEDFTKYGISLMMYSCASTSKISTILCGHNGVNSQKDFDDFGVVGKRWISGFQRHENHQNPFRIESVHGTFLIYTMSDSAASDTLFRRNGVAIQMCAFEDHVKQEFDALGQRPPRPSKRTVRLFCLIPLACTLVYFIFLASSHDRIRTVK